MTTLLQLGLEQMNCASCGLSYAVDQRWATDRREDHLTFYCPNGHNQWFPGETEAERLKRQLNLERDRNASLLADRDQAKASLRTTKGVVTKLRKRVAAGECPYCGQHLRDLERHVTRQHSAEAAEAIAEPVE